MNATRQPAKTITVVLLSIALLLISAGVLRAAPLSDYLTRVSSAITLIEEVRGVYEHGSSRSSPEQVVAGNLALVRQRLPAKETIKLDGQTISVDNSWLYQALSDFEKSTNSNDRQEAIARIAERLQAIHEHLQELQKATIAAGTDKAGAVGMALSGAGPVQLPAAGVLGVSRTLWLLDRAAAARVAPRFRSLR